MEFLAVQNGLFNGLLMNKDEQFNLKNKDIYVKFLKYLLEYFGKWKEAQLQRKKNGDPHSEISFLDPITFRNLRITISGFCYFTQYLLETLPDNGSEQQRGRRGIPGFYYVPMQTNNQTPLEGMFGAERAQGLATAEKHCSFVTNVCGRQALAALKNDNCSYRAQDDILAVNDDCVSMSKMSAFKNFQKQITQALDKWSLPLKDDNGPPMEVSRFGNKNPIHTTKATEIFANEMTIIPLKHGFRKVLMHHASFREWFRLSQHVKTKRQWFENFAKARDEEINEVCQMVLRKYFALMEETIHWTAVSFESQYMWYLLGDDFNKLIAEQLPKELRGNRPCAAHFTEALKCLFESWYFDAAATLTRKNVDDCTDCNDDYLDDESLFIQVHNITGGVIPDLKKKWSHHPQALSLIKRMVFKHTDCKDNKSFYDKYVPEYVRHRNKGGFSLISETFMDWSIDLMKFCIEKNSEEQIKKHRSRWIAVGFDQIKDNQSPLYLKFRQIAFNIEKNLDETISYAIYERISLHTMRTYSKFRNNVMFNEEKSSRDDMTNVKFRTKVQTGVHVSTKKARPRKKNFSEYVARVNAINGVKIVEGTVDKGQMLPSPRKGLRKKDQSQDPTRKSNQTMKLAVHL